MNHHDLKIRDYILIAVTVVALCIGGWFGYWALAKKSVSNRYDINTNTQQYQAALIAQERDRVTGFDASTDEAQRNTIASEFCTIYADLTRPPADLVSAHDRLC